MLYTIIFKNSDNILLVKGLNGCVNAINRYIETNSVRSNYISKDIVSNMTCRNYYPKKWDFIRIRKENLEPKIILI
jgi:murein L,D-transpeptidase YafK